jgi:PAS domain S-box-containing protein
MASSLHAWRPCAHPNVQKFLSRRMSAQQTQSRRETAPARAATGQDDVRRQAATLASRAATLEAALWSISEAVCIIDADGNLEQCNDSFRGFYRFRPDEFRSGSLREFLEYVEACTLDGRPLLPHERLPGRALRGESGQDVELALRRRDTGEKWIAAFSFAPIRDANGAVIGAVLAGRDITERRRLEQQLLRSEQRWRFALDGGSQGVWDWDILADTTYESAGYSAMLGRQASVRVLPTSSCATSTPTTSNACGTVFRVTSGATVLSTSSSSGCAARTAPTSGSNRVARSSSVTPPASRHA